MGKYNQQEDEQQLIWLCASNTTHVRTWTKVISELISLDINLRCIIISLESYYLQVNNTLLEQSGLPYCILQRDNATKSYWECSAFRKILEIHKARIEIDKLIDKHQPSLVVVGNDVGIIEKLILAAAKEHDIPSLLVQDGILRYTKQKPQHYSSILRNVFWDFLGLSKNTTYGLGDASRVAVMGEYTRELLKYEGADMQKVTITGQPRFDDLIQIRDMSKNSDLAQMITGTGIPLDKKIIGFFTQPMIRYRYMTPEKWDYIVRTVLQVGITLRNEFNLLIKLHPAEDKFCFEERYKKYLEQLEGNVYFGENLLINLMCSNVVVVHSSTVALEAIIVDKPVIFFNPWKECDDYQFVRMGAALTADSETTLKLQIKRIMSDQKLAKGVKKGQREAVHFHIGELDRLASQRVAYLIIDMLRGIG